MGERFQRVKPALPFEWTGERLTTGTTGQVEVEHLHRYFVARHLCRGLDVLDIASGEGYGAALLAQTAKSVVGVELDPEVVHYASAAYVAQNLRFEQGDARAIPLPDHSVDCVVSFETIEHFYDHDQFLAEIRRVLRPAGKLIISSPDRDVYSPPGSRPNPYHVRELTRAEFAALLQGCFAHVALFGQRPIVGSVLVPSPESGAPPASMTFERRTEDDFEAASGLDRALYWVAVASDASLPPATQSFYFERAAIDDAMVALPAERLLSANKSSELAQKDAQIKQKDAELALALQNIGELQAHLRRLDDLIAGKDLQINEYLYHLDRINDSGWWRLGMQLDKFIRAPAALFAARNAQPQDAPQPPSPRAALPAVTPQTIILPSPGVPPDASVVILGYGQVDYTLRCLASIARHPPACSIEVIVSDDCSGAPGLETLKAVANVTLWRTPQNLGFLKHANWAVAQSSGRFVLLLNNDTELKPGAIDALVETAKQTPDVGLIGAKLVYPDGRLQEAGGIVWDDASAWNYGRLDDPDKPEYNYVRDADYVSGAAILVPRAVWDRVGGFDEVFAPAYYEDTDLAFRLRQNGLRVLYQPRAVVVHHEGVSHGSDLNVGVKANQVVNKTRMKERWRSTLAADHYRNGDCVARARDRAKDKRVVLMIDHYVPEPDRDAGSRNMICLIESLRAAGWIVKFWGANLRYDPVYTERLQQTGVETAYAPWVTSFDDWLSKRADAIDLVFLSRPTTAQNFIDSLERIAPATPTIFYGHDLHFARMRMQSRVLDDKAVAAEADVMETLERRMWRKVDLVLYPSEEEADEVRRMEPGVDARALVPFCFDAFRPAPSPPSSSVLLFVAGFAHPPNADAAIWFATKILPLVQRDAPDVKLWIVGSNPTPEVKKLAGDSIEVTGYVTKYELERRYREARVAVIPLRIGAGVKLKVVEGLHEGLPLVTTPIGAQGLKGLDEAARVVDGAEAFAREILTLLTDDAAWAGQAQRQLDYARAHFSREASVAALAEATDAAAKNTEKRGRH